MGQDTETAGGATAGGRPGPQGPVVPMTPPNGYRPVPGTPTGDFPVGPRPPYTQHPGEAQYPGQAPYRPYPGPYVPGPRPTPTGPQGVASVGPYAWDPAEDDEDPGRESNVAAAFSVILGLVALLLSLRPLAFGSMAMSWDTYVALGIAVLALVPGAVGLRRPVARPVAVVGMMIAVAAMLVVAVLPTI
jgi:hypothetical protein